MSEHFTVECALCKAQPVNGAELEVLSIGVTEMEMLSVGVKDFNTGVFTPLATAVVCAKCFEQNTRMIWEIRKDMIGGTG